MESNSCIKQSIALIKKKKKKIGWQHCADDLLNQNTPHGRVLQHSGRPTLEKQDHLYRVGSLKENFPDNFTTGTQVAGRTLCNPPKQPTRHIYESLPRHQSRCSRRLIRRHHISRLGYIGSHLSLSSESNDFDGFSQNATIKYQNNNTRIKSKM